MAEKKKKAATPKKPDTPDFNHPNPLVTLVNQGPAPVTLVLFHKQVCIKTGRCTCRGGKPSSVHLPVGVPIRNLDPAVLLCDDAKRAKIKVRPVRQLTRDQAHDGKVALIEYARADGAWDKKAKAHLAEMKKVHADKVKAAKGKGKGAAEKKEEKTT